MKFECQNENFQKKSKLFNFIIVYCGFTECYCLKFSENTTVDFDFLKEKKEWGNNRINNSLYTNLPNV